MSGPMVVARTLELNEETGGDPEFSASQGWLQKWKKRHDIREISMQGERLSVDFEGVGTDIQEFQVKKMKVRL